MREIEIAGRKLGDGHAPFIVGEVGINHNGSVPRALHMVRIAKLAGCDAVKFGTFKADEFCAKSDPLYPVFKSCELPDDAWRLLKSEADREEIIFFSTPQNRTDLDVLLKVGIPCVKVGSDDLANTALLEDYATVGLPMILSTGMADALDVRLAAHAVGNIPLCVCACTSEYPCPPEHANLRRITTLREILPGVPIGFSDHTRGVWAGAVAAGLGASYFEKHITADNLLPGPDHAFALQETEMRKWVYGIRNAFEMLGDGEIKPTDIERENRTKWRRASGQKIRGVAA